MLALVLALGAEPREAAEAGTDGAPRQVIFLGKSPQLPVVMGGKRYQCLLARELVRQALLIGARDELGLVARDVWAGDPLPDLADPRLYDLAVPAGKVLQIHFIQGSSKSARPIGVAEVRLDGDLDYLRLLVEMERLSRTRFVELLKDASFHGQPHRRNAQAMPPREVKAWLEEMASVPQFVAVRRLHEVMRQQGESDALLAALSRAYAQLGVLTEFHWHPAHKVFKARALLYAQRMVARNERSPQARWTRAFALALAGLHEKALDDLQAAAKCWDSAEPSRRGAKPPWVDALSTFCHCDYASLARKPGTATDTQLAQMLRCTLMEDIALNAQRLSSVFEIAKFMPKCERVQAAAMRTSLSGARSAMPAIMVRALYQRLSAIRDLPPSARKIVDGQLKRAGGDTEQNAAEEIQARVGLMDALGGAADSSDLSWATLGHVIRENAFIQVWRQVDEVRNALGTSADEEIRFLRPLVAGHRFATYIETFAWEPEQRRKALQKLAQVVPESLDLQGLPMCWTLARLDNDKSQRWIAQATAHNDEVFHDLYTRLILREPDAVYLPLAHKLMAVSPHCMYAKLCLLISDWPHVRQLIPQWAREGANDPMFLTSLSKRYRVMGRYDEAIAAGEKVVRLVPDCELNERLVGIYRDLGDEDRVRTTLEKCLQLPGHGFDHPRVHYSLAWYYIKRKEWQQALPHALAAAETYSAWGLRVAAICYEALGKWEEAEQMWRAQATRYREDGFNWYFFCRRTGRGDLAAAHRVAEEYAKYRRRAVAPEDEVWLGRYNLLEGRVAEALKSMKALFHGTGDMLTGLEAALMADRLKDSAQRDAILKQAQRESRRVIDGVASVELIDLCDMLIADQARGGHGDLDLDAVDRLCPRETGERTAFRDVVATYLDLHGKPDEAVRYWKLCLLDPVLDRPERVMAAAELRRRGVGEEVFADAVKCHPKDEKGLPPDAAVLGSLARPQGRVYLDDLKETSYFGEGTLGKHGQGVHPNEKIYFRGACPAHALTIYPREHSKAEAVYALDGKYAALSAKAAIYCLESDGGGEIDVSQTFRVYGDGKLLWQSRPLSFCHHAEECKIDVRGVKSLVLQVRCPLHNRQAWTAWIDPFLAK